MVDFINEVEKFIRRRDNGEFIVTPIAREAKYLYIKPSSDSPIERLKNTMPLSDCLANSLKTYIFNTDENAKLDLAITCYNWINTAWSCGALQEGQGLASKLDECREEKGQIEKELIILSSQYNALQKQFEKFTKTVKLKTKRDVEKEGT